MNLSHFNPPNIKAVFSDLDDTLTENGKILPSTYRALWALKDGGLGLVIVSGRPAGWADAIMRLWPVDHVIFENGAGVMSWEKNRVVTKHLAPTESREMNRARLVSIFSALKTRFPLIKPASDQFCRLFDYTIDYSEEPPHLDETTVEALMTALRAEKGITAKLSSIHINYWVGEYSKVTACKELLSRYYSSDRTLIENEVVFVGDSPNDEPLFGYFSNSVGVANIAPFLPRMISGPKFIADALGGKGFEQVVARLLTSGMSGHT